MGKASQILMIDEYVVSWQRNQWPGHCGIQILEAKQAIVVVIFKSSFHVIIAKDISERIWWVNATPILLIHGTVDGPSPLPKCLQASSSCSLSCRFL